MKNLQKNGLTGFDLKYLVLIFMVLDHIHYFFEFTGMIPIWFSWLGRLAAPLFLFCLIEGFIHTHDKKRYFLKIYSISIIMGLIRFGFYNVLDFAVRGDGFFPLNAMLSSFVVLLVVLMGIDWIREKKYFIGILAVVIPVILPYLFIYFVYIPFADNLTINIITSLINFTILPLHTMIQDGGTITLIEGVTLYLFSFCKNKNTRIYAFVTFELLYGIGLVTLSIGSFNVHTLIFEAFEWMSAFSAIFMLCYNGQRGHGNSRFFYLFPIIFLSAKALEEDVIYGLSIGADDYIRKPFAIAELRARVAAHIRRDKRDHIACIKDGNISIYPDSRLVQVNGKELSLTKSEFDIALLLVRNKGQVFSKEQIYEKIYGFDKDGDESAVTEHIKNLRKKLSDAGNIIETVWGIGYRWKKEQEAKAQMAQIAHDLKTPLTVIRGNADLLMEKEYDEESKESLEAIIRNSEKIAMSVLDILEK